VTIHGRVTLWYVAVLFVSLFLTGGGMYYELVYEPESYRKKGQPLAPLEQEVGEIFLYFIIPAMIVTVVGGWWVLRRSLAPLDHLTVAAERIGAENLRESLPRTFNGDEVDRLSQVLNAMNQRLSDAMNEIHEFTLHASHELKTPLTILHSEIETALGTWPITPEQRESLASQLDEIQRLSRIVEGLGLLARTNSGQMPFAQDPVPFHDIVKDTAEDTAILARSKQINVEIQAVEEAMVLGDRHRLRQMLLNLAENASKYNSAGGSITIAARATPATVIFEIANTGSGIRQEDLPNLFKKFYRGAVERPGDPGGVGLGLSIAQSIANAHRGEVNIETTRAGWITVRVVLPRIARTCG
jgi:signal transduction histidine kinase